MIIWLNDYKDDTTIAFLAHEIFRIDESKEPDYTIVTITRERHWATYKVKQSIRYVAEEWQKSL